MDKDIDTINLRRSVQIAKMIKKNKPSGKVLDVGCGAKEIKRFLDKSYDYYGIDFYDYGLKINKFRKVDLNKKEIPFKNEKFDVIICSEVLEHIFYPHEIIKEMQHLLKDDGIMVLTLPNEITLDSRIRCLFGEYPPRINMMSHHWFFTMPEAKKFLIENTSLQIIDKYYLFGVSGGRFLTNR